MIPLAALFVTGLIALFAAFAKKSQVVIGIVVVGILTTIGLLVREWNNPYMNMKYQGIIMDKYAIAFSIITLTLTLLVCLVAYDRYKNRLEHVGDYYSLLVFSACGALCLFSFTDLFMLFLGIEILSIPLYVLAGSKKNDLRSNEAALKYFIMGAFATGILLFGMTLIYGSTASFNVNTISMIASTQEHMPSMFYVGVIMMLCAFCFKVGAAPFHFWSPDVYTGSPTIITSFMATVVKIAAFGAFMKLFFSCFGMATSYWAPTLAVIAGLTMTIANITAVFQDNFKRMLAYSSVAHVGYILMALVASNHALSVFNLMFYLVSYSLATLLIFTVYMRVKDHAAHEGVSAFNGLGKSQPWMALAVIIGIVSLAGIPPTAGFFGKYFLFANVFNDYPWLVIVAILNSTISIYYYFKVVIAMYFTEADGNATPVSCLPTINAVVVVICSLGVISLGVLSGLLGKLLY
jgi:NADH-quinone oxidoreductase subunit N